MYNPNGILIWTFKNTICHQNVNKSVTAPQTQNTNTEVTKTEILVIL